MSWRKLNNIKKVQKLAGIQKPKAKKKEHIYNNIKFDSAEEIWFMWWLEELQDAGIVLDMFYHEESFNIVSCGFQAVYPKHKELKRSIKTVDTAHNITAHREYTPDFKFTVVDNHNLPFFVEMTANMEQLSIKRKPGKNDLLLQRDKETGNWICYVDIKPAYMDHVASQLFGLQQSIMMEKHGIYVNKVIPHDSSKKPSCLFQNSFIPDRFTRTEVRKDLKSFKYLKHSIKDLFPF